MAAASAFMIGKKSAARYLKGVAHYQFSDILGEGTDSVVRKGISSTDPSAIWAVKIVPKIILVDQKGLERFQLSLEILQRLVHPGIVGLHEVLKDGLYYYVVLEFCSGGSLRSYIVSHKKLNLSEARSLFFQILTALQYVHDQGVAHRDLKPENILLDSANQTKINDFGFGRFGDARALCTGSVGTPGYTSPECLSGKPYDGLKSDVWSAGLILYAMVTGRLPWDTQNKRQIANQIKSGRFEIPTIYGAGFSRVIRAMLNPDVERRVSVREILEDPWITGIEWPAAGLAETSEEVQLKQVPGVSGEKSRAV
jgi:serine/threonine protein kinase